MARKPRQRLLWQEPGQAHRLSLQQQLRFLAQRALNQRPFQVALPQFLVKLYNLPHLTLHRYFLTAQRDNAGFAFQRWGQRLSAPSFCVSMSAII